MISRAFSSDNAVDPATVRANVAAGYWQEETLVDYVSRHARLRAEESAFIGSTRAVSWREYDAFSDRLAEALVGLGLERGERVAILMPDGPTVHASYIAAEKAGVVVVGIGPRAAEIEVNHLLRTSQAKLLVTLREHRGSPIAEFVDRLDREGLGFGHMCLAEVETDDTEAWLLDGTPFGVPGGSASADVASRRFGPNDLFLLNSTSGTTGLPKCVKHHQNRWFYFHSLAVEAGRLGAQDVFLSTISAPFGFGLWTAHFTPTLLGAPTVVLPRFSPEEVLAAIERERVTVLACVSTQFIMLLNCPTFDQYDTTSLRVMFTGGEAVSYERASEFEDRTGARVLQFYGSNETGALSRTSLTDDRERRLRTAGRVIDEMQVRLINDSGNVITESGVAGQPACNGPAVCMGYYRDYEANQSLYTADGWMRTGDIATIDRDGYLCVVGRKSDFIIRGGKNISAVAVEEHVMSHPDVEEAAAVAFPDEVYGERVCVFVVTRGSRSLSMPLLVEHLALIGASKETFPERLEVVSELPRSSGGKVAKAELRRRASDGSSAGSREPTRR